MKEPTRTLIPCYHKTRLAFVVAINIFQRSSSRLWIKEIRDGDEAETDDGPNDPESPAKVLDPGRRYLNNHVVLEVSA